MKGPAASIGAKRLVLALGRYLMRLAIIGGASGIGAKTISLLQSLDHELVVFDLHEPTADVTYIPLDLMNGEGIETAIAKAEGTFDGLAFIAGIPPRDDNAAACLTVNTISTVQFISGFMNKLNDGAAIVTVASRAGLGWQDNMAMLNDILSRGQDEMQAFCDAGNIDAATAYRLSKQAVIYWHQMQVPDHIGKHRFVTVSPAAVSTGILDDFINAFGPGVAKNLERVGRAGKPEEVASVIAFLLSQEANWINGIDIVIDGGMGAFALAAD